MDALRAHDITNFSLPEVVPPFVLDNYSDERAIHFLDLRALRGWQFIRTARGNPIFMNTYGIDVPEGYPVFENRGLRIIEGFATTQHAYGRAYDGDEYGTYESELYEWIMQERIQKELIKLGVTTIEHIDSTPTWIHLDSRNWGLYNQNKLQVVRPAI